MSIDDFFSGNIDDRVERHKVFTNRTSELTELLAQVSAAAARQHTLAELTDFRRAAHNVCVIHGEGGMGKTALLGRLAELFLDAQTEGSRQSVAQIDFADVNSRDYETVLMRVRSAMSSAHHRWPTFDLGFTHYWQRKHPGANVVDFLKEARFLARHEREAVVEQFTGIIDALVGGTGLINAGYKLATILRERLTSSRAVRRLRVAYPPFGRLMDEEDPDTVLAYLGTLLAYDLEVARRDRPLAALCIMDTFETVQHLRPELGNVEDLVSRLVYLLPNVAFVIGTRVPLDWHEDRRNPTLFYGGAQRWPGLGNPGTQMVITGLDATSAEQLLTGSLTIDDSPAMPPMVRDRIIRGSYGLPLYLELSINWYRQMLLRGGIDAQIDQVDFVGTFPELVLRLMRDLSATERDLLRAAAALEAFSEEILRLLIPSARPGEVQGFLRRAFIVKSFESWLPFSLHEVFRTAVVEHDEYTHGAWSANEWKDKALKATDWLADEALSVWDEETAAAMSTDSGRRSVAALLLSVEAGRRHDVVPRRLGELAFAARNLGYMRAFESLPQPRADGGSELDRLIAVAQASSARAITSMERYERTGRQARFDPSSSIDHFIAAELGIVAEVVGKHRIAQEAYEFTRRGPAVIAEFGALGLAYNHLRTGRLATALSVIPTTLNHPFFKSSVLDFEGHVRLQGGDFQRAVELFQESLGHARLSGAPLLVARALRHIAHSGMWFDPDVTLGVVSEAEEINIALGERVGAAQCEMARAMAAAWLNQWDECWELLRRCQGHGLDPLAIGHPWMVEAFLCKALGDEEGVARAASVVFLDERFTRTDAERPHAWYAVTALFADRPEIANFGSVEWYDSETAARGRWQAALDRMRRSVGRDRGSTH